MQVAAQVINTGDGPGLKEPIDCADSNDCFCNEMILTGELRVIGPVSSEYITRYIQDGETQEKHRTHGS